MIYVLSELIKKLTEIEFNFEKLTKKLTEILWLFQLEIVIL